MSIHMNFTVQSLCYVCAMLDTRGTNPLLDHTGTLPEALERPHWIGHDQQPFLGKLLLPVVQLR